VALDQHSALIVLVGGQTPQRLSCRLQRRDRIRLLAQRSVESVGDPGPPRRDFAPAAGTFAPAEGFTTVCTIACSYGDAD
jgi:hypothetical protein